MLHSSWLRAGAVQTGGYCCSHHCRCRQGGAERRAPTAPAPERSQGCPARHHSQVCKASICISQLPTSRLVEAHPRARPAATWRDRRPAQGILLTSQWGEPRQHVDTFRCTCHASAVAFASMPKCRLGSMYADSPCTEPPACHAGYPGHADTLTCQHSVPPHAVYCLLMGAAGS